jgi:hypothetical protein
MKSKITLALLSLVPGGNFANRQPGCSSDVKQNCGSVVNQDQKTGEEVEIEKSTKAE